MQKSQYNESSAIKSVNHGYSVKNFKTFMGMDMTGFNFSMYKDNKKVADVTNDGGGGETEVGFLSDAVETDFNNMLKLLPEYYCDISKRNCKFNEEDFVNELAAQYEEDKKLKRLCKTKTLFITADCGQNECRTVKHVFNANVKKFIQNKYKKDLIEIINERFN